MNSLFTLTGNLLAETTALYPAIVPGKTHRATGERFQVGGKGINVARMAERLGLSSCAICFPGGATGERCLAWLAGQSFSVRAFPQSTETRSGWVVRSGSIETTFLGQDQPLEEKPWLAAMRFLEETATPGDTIAICGSIPGWRRELADPLAEFIRKFAGKIFIAVDTYGAPLESLVRGPIDLVKINRDELRALRKGDSNGESVAEMLRALRIDFPQVRQWVVTDGAGPIRGIDSTGARIRAVPPPAATVVSRVGCGDVFLAGVIHELTVNKASLGSAIEVAIPLAAANAASPGIADFPLPGGA